MPIDIIKELQSDCGHDLNQIVTKEKSENNIKEMHHILDNYAQYDENLRRNTIYVLGKWGDISAINKIDKLMPMLNEREKIVAIKAFHSIATNEAYECIDKYTSDSSPQVRKFILKALANNPTPRYRESIKLMLKNEKENFLKEMALKYLNEK